MTLLTSYPETNADKKYPAIPLKLNGKTYLAFEYPHPATNVVQDLNLFDLYKRHYEVSEVLIADQEHKIKVQDKEVRQQKIRRVLSIIGFSLGGSLTGFATGWVVHALR
jgi:hypothetical protein